MEEKTNPLIELHKKVSTWNEIYDTMLRKTTNKVDLSEYFLKSLSYINGNVILDESSTENLRKKLKNIEYIIGKDGYSLNKITSESTALIEECISKRLIKKEDYDKAKIEIKIIKESRERFIQAMNKLIIHSNLYEN